MSAEERRRLADERERERREARREVERARAVKERFDRELEGLIEDLHELVARTYGDGHETGADHARHD